MKSGITLSLICGLALPMPAPADVIATWGDSLVGGDNSEWSSPANCATRLI